MITLITGENSFENERSLARIIVSAVVQPEMIDGSTLELKQMPDLLMGATLFTTERLVIIKQLSENKAVWSVFGEWLGRVSDDIHLVLVEPKPDKRTKTYKDLQKVATVHESKAWDERDTAKAEQWVGKEAGALGFTLDKKSAHTLVARVGVNQWQLYRALEKLAVLENITPQIIEEHIEANPIENVFNVFEAALKGNAPKVQKMITTLELSEDPYRLIGLLSTQALQLVALVLAEKPSTEVAKDMGVHPFALQKLSPYAKKMSKHEAKRVLDAFIEADEALKTSAGDPWLLIVRALTKVCQAV